MNPQDSEYHHWMDCLKNPNQPLHCLPPLQVKKSSLMTEIKGDLFRPFARKEFDLMVHGCNCFHSFGKGFAAIVKHKYPQAHTADKKTPKGSRAKMGTYSQAETEHGIIINLYSQFHYGFGSVNCDIGAIKEGFALLNEEYKGKKVCIPRIGAGLAKGDWNKIKPAIESVTPDLDITVFIV